MKRFLIAAAAVTAVAAPASAATVYNSTPADSWYFGTTGNDTQGDTAVLTTTDGNQLYLRWKQFNQGVPAGTGANGVYQFTTSQTPLSFDWGFDTSGSLPANSGAAAIVSTSSLTITNLGTGGTFSYNPAADPSNDFTDRSGALNGSVQNSARLNFGFLAPIGYVAGTNQTFRVTLAVAGLPDGAQSLSVDAVVGTGAAVPEPATWALMLAGFGLTGVALRSRRRAGTAMAA